MPTLREPFDHTYPREIKNARREVVKVVDTILWHQVADRLDEAEEVASWSFAIIGHGDDWAHGRLTIVDHQGESRGYENFGYVENAEAEWKKEPLKDAASDALKRCAALAGVGRYLYDKERPQHPAPARQAPPQPIRADNQRVQALIDAEDEANPFDDPASTAPIIRPEETRCPWHPNREPKQGKYGLYCSGQGGSGPLNSKGYCEWKGAA